MIKRGAICALVAGLSGVCAAEYAQPWVPDWENTVGYSHQSWVLHGTGPGGQQPPQLPVVADGTMENPLGDATATWDTASNGMVGWLPIGMGAGQPEWAIGVYGGMTGMAPDGPFAMTLTVPADQPCKLWLQVDWYAAGELSLAIPGASDITPGSYEDYLLATSGTGNSWFRTTKVYQVAPDSGQVRLELAISGLAPMIDQVSVTTSADGTVPAVMPVPEPTTLLAILCGSWALIARGRNR